MRKNSLGGIGMCMDVLDVYQVIKSRRSIRKYKADMVPKTLILKILDAANWAPSGMNEQPWEFIVVAGEQLNALRTVCKEVIDARTPPETRTEEQKAFAYWYATLGGAPVAIIQLCNNEVDVGRRKMVLESAAASFQNLLLAAAAEHLGTCWMTGLLAKQKDIHAIFDIPDTKEIVAVTPLGYPDERPNAVPRKDAALQEKVTWVGF
jgi:nitroreductase